MSNSPVLQLAIQMFLSGWLLSSAHAIEFVTVGDPGNLPDSTGLGSVAAVFNIGKYEVSNREYAEFLNAKAASDPHSLYNLKMASSPMGGIIQGGAEGALAYAVKPGYENMPVVFVSFFDAMRFTNWLQNGSGNSNTETGAYTLSLGGLAPRNAGARFWIPSENEWYKAAYYQPAAAGGDADSYWFYPTRSNSPPNSRNGSSSDPNSANFYSDDALPNGFNDGFAKTGSIVLLSTQNYLTEQGAFSKAASYYGTFDQAGNAWEATDVIFSLEQGRGLSGGSWRFDDSDLAPSFRYFNKPDAENDLIGFRVATIPEPATAVLLLLGLHTAGFRRRKTGLSTS